MVSPSTLSNAADGSPRQSGQSCRLVRMITDSWSGVGSPGQSSRAHQCRCGYDRYFWLRSQRDTFAKCAGPRAIDSPIEVLPVPAVQSLRMTQNGDARSCRAPCELSDRRLGNARFTSSALMVASTRRARGWIKAPSDRFPHGTARTNRLDRIIATRVRVPIRSKRQLALACAGGPDPGVRNPSPVFFRNRAVRSPNSLRIASI